MTASVPDPAGAKLPDDVHATWIDHPDSLRDWLARCGRHELLGMDTEFMRRNTFFPELALLQLADGERYALVDPTCFDTGPLLEAHFDAHPDLVCVMHSPGEDLEALSGALPHGLPGLFDTQLAAAFAGMGLGISYRALVTAVDGVELDKGETRSDWLQRPLTASQKTYATLDVVYLAAAYHQLRERLRVLGRTAWHAEDCERLNQRATRRQGDPQPQRGFRGAADWPIERQALLRRILRWRESKARELDTPKPWLFEDAQALALVDDPPATERALADITRGRRSLRSAQRHELLQLLQAPLEADDIEGTERIVGHPQGAAKRALDAMKRVVNATAQDLDLPPGLLCARKQLEFLVMHHSWPEALQGWREPLLHDALMPLLPDGPEN